MKKALGIMLVLGVMLAVTPASHAEETKSLQEIFEQCGIGGLLFPEWPIGASVSNFTWDWGSTASTSGLTTPDACKGGKAKMAAYIYESYDSIEQDLAKGDGKYLDMLVYLSETQESQKGAFVTEARSNFLQLVKNTEDYSSLSRLEKAKLMFNMIEGLS